MSNDAPEQQTSDRFHLGDRLITPFSNEIDGVRVETKAMEVLVALADAAPAVLSAADLLDRVWPNVVVVDNVVHQSISLLRKALGDDARAARYIESIPRRGYRLIAKVTREAPVANTAGNEHMRGRSDSIKPRRAVLAFEGHGDDEARAIHKDASPLLAVLPLDNLSNDPELQYFSDGIAEEILQTVARTTKLRTVGRSSSFQFRGADKSIPHVAAVLLATHVLDGSVRRSGARVRIAAHLIECATQTTLWSDRFDRDLSDVFALQDEIAAAVAAALSATFAPSAQIGSIDSVAYDLYLRARASPTANWQGGADANLLEATVARAPQFAKAWAALAMTHALEAQGITSIRDETSVGFEETPRWRARAMQAAEQALALDSKSGIVYAALSVLEPVCGAFARIEALLVDALSLSPEDPDVLFRWSRFSRTVGRLHDACNYSRRAYLADPLVARIANDHIDDLENIGQDAEAARLWDEARARWPEVPYIANREALVRGRMGDWAQVDKVVASIAELGPHTDQVRQFLAREVDEVRHWTPASSARLLAEFSNQLATTGTMNISVVPLACQKGMTDAAYELLEQASFTHLFDAGGHLLSGDAGLRWLFQCGGDAMQQDIRFVKLCARLGLCDYWVQSGTWPDCADHLAGHYDFRAEARRLLVHVRGGVPLTSAPGDRR